MEEWQTRVVQEKAALDDKIRKLNAFFPTRKFTDLTPRNQQLLRDQHTVMERYSRILGWRIELF